MEVCSTGKREEDSKGDAVDLTVAVTASGSEDKGEKTPGKGGFMEAAVDNIIAAGTCVYLLCVFCNENCVLYWYLFDALICCHEYVCAPILMHYLLLQQSCLVPTW